MTIQRTKQWFELAVANPTERNKVMQAAVHLEEVAEMLETIGSEQCPELITESHRMLVLLSNMMKKNADVQVTVTDRVELLDSLCDQIVTAIGVAHMHGMDILGALAEVNNSNFSKFKDGVPQFDENGKISKNLETYKKPELAQFV